jgi:hypothetical protein
MKCNTCGRQTLNEEANFCEYCGSSFRENNVAAINSDPGMKSYLYNEAQKPFTNPHLQSTVNPSDSAEAEKPVTFLNWLGTYGLLFIPFVGGLLFIVMLLIWSFGGNVPASKKSWARATLIFAAVMIIFFVVYVIVIMSTPMFQDMMNGTFDYNSFYNSLNQSTY